MKYQAVSYTFSLSALIAVLVGLAQQVSAEETTVYGLDHAGSWGWAESGDQRSAQPFTTGARGEISSISMPLQRFGNPGGFFQVELWSDAGGTPGRLLAVIGEIDLVTVPEVETVIRFDQPVAGLQPNTVHHVVVDFRGATLGVGGEDTVAQSISTAPPNADPAAGDLIIQLLPGGAWHSAAELIGSADGVIWRASMTVVESDLEGFAGHEVTFSGRYYFEDGTHLQGSPLVVGSSRVGPEAEFIGRTIDLGGGQVFSAATFDLGSHTIDLDMAHLAGNTTDPGLFNGYVIEDTNGTLPDFRAVTIDTTSSTLIPDEVLVSPNSIWISFNGITIPANAFVRLDVTFAEAASSRPISLTPASDGNMILEAPAEVGMDYQFEQSADLTRFTPIDRIYRAEAPFVQTLLQPSARQMFYRLRRVE